MTNRNIIISVVVLAVILFAGGMYFYNQKMSQNQISYMPSSKQGKVIIGITDAAASMEGISAINMTVSKVEIQSQTKGWITLSSAMKQYDLWALKGSGAIMLLADADVDVGTYNQIRLMVEKVVVVKNSVEEEAKLPSGELKINGKIVVEENKESTVVFDFLADKSLHTTGSGKLIFTPVIQLETRSNADVTINSNSEIRIQGGKVQTNQNLGMDISGEIKTNFQVDADAKLEIIGNVIKITTNEENNASLKITATAAINAVISAKQLDVATSVRLQERNNAKVWVVSGIKGLELKNIMVDAQTGVIIGE